MSGDRMTKTDLLTAESLAEQPESDICKKPITPTTAAAVTLPSHNDRLYAQEGHGDLASPTRYVYTDRGNVYTDRSITITMTGTVSGHVIHSNLNPNAVEFVPYFKQQQNTQVIEQQNLVYEKENVNAKENEKVILKENKESEYENEYDLIVREQMVEELNESNLTNNVIIEEIVRAQGCSDTIENVTADKKTTELDDKLEQNAETSNLFILFESSSVVKNTSSETVLTENVPIDQTQLRLLCCEEDIETDGTTSFRNASNKSSSEQNLLKEHLEVEKNVEHCKTETKDCIANLVGLPKDVKTTAVAAAVPKISIENENKSISKKEHQTSHILNSPRKNLNAHTKIATPSPTTASTRTVRKVTFSKISRTAELKKDNSQPKSKPVIAQYTLNKSCKNNSTAQPNSNIKCAATLSSSKPSTRPQRTDTITKNPNKDTTAANAAAKRILPNRSNLLNSKLKCAAKPVLQGQDQQPEGCLSKNPRPTVSSKLRRTETQKRRNLFFDIDSIKMSEFLFK